MFAGELNLQLLQALIVRITFAIIIWFIYQYLGYWYHEIGQKISRQKNFSSVEFSFKPAFSSFLLLLRCGDE